VLGDRVIGEMTKPYIIDPELGKVLHPERSDNALVQLCGLLSSSKPQVLLAIIFLIVTLLRSWVKQIGADWQAILYIVGMQGFGKTTLAHLLTDWHRDVEGDTDLFFEAGSTMAAIRDQMAQARDLPVVVDDLCKSSSKTTERQRKELGARLVREGANSAPIIKKLPGGKIRKQKCAAGVILTAEVELENASDITRCIFVNIDQPLDLPADLTADLVGGAIETCIKWFLEHQQEAKTKLEMRLECGIPENINKRIANNLLVIGFVFWLFTKAASAAGVSAAIINLLIKAITEAIKTSISYTNNLLLELSSHRKQANLAAVLLEGLRQDAFNLTKKIEKLNKHEGVIWKGDLCLKKSALERFVRIQNGYQNYTISKIIQELKDIGALVLQEEGTAQVKIKKRFAEGLSHSNKCSGI